MINDDMNKYNKENFWFHFTDYLIWIVLVMVISLLFNGGWIVILLCVAFIIYGIYKQSVEEEKVRHLKDKYKK